MHVHNNYASPSSGESYRDRRLTTNFEFWVEIFCMPTCFHMRIPKPCLSVHLSVPREKKSPWLRQYQSYIGNWYINGKVFTSTTYSMETQKFEFFFKKVRNSNFDLWQRVEITLASSISVYISNKYINEKVFTSTTPWSVPILVINTSMERSSRVLHHGNLKIWIFF